MFCSTLLCRYTFSLSDGRVIEVESMDVAKLMAKLLKEDDILRKAIDAHSKIPVVLGTLMTFCLPGSPRDTQILRFRGGITNWFFTKKMVTDLMASNALEGTKRDDLLVGFNRLK